MIQFRKPKGFLEKMLNERDRAAYTITGAKMTDTGGVQYLLDWGGEPRAFESDEQSVLRSFWVEGATLTDVTLDGNDLLYTVAER